MKCDICGEYMQAVSIAKMPITGTLSDTPILSADMKRFPFNLNFCDQCGNLMYEPIDEALEVINEVNLHYPSTGDFYDLEGNERLLFCRELQEKTGLAKNDVVLDIGCNSGQLLHILMQNIGCKVIGVEPSKILSAYWKQFGLDVYDDKFNIDRSRGIIINEFFDKNVVSTLAKFGINVFVLSHVLEHIPDANGLLQSIADLMHNDSYLVIEVPYFKDTINNMRFDDFVFEHIHHFTIRSMAERLKRFRLGIVDYTTNDCGGGSIRFYIKKDIDTDVTQYDKLTFSQISAFVNALEYHRNRVHCLIEHYPEGTVVGYGGKMAQFLVYLYQLQDFITVIWNDLDLYEGKYVPGTTISYHKPQVYIQQNMVKAVINLAPYYDKEIKEKVRTLGDYSMIELI